MSNGNYADYVPDRISPKLLSKEFLLYVLIKILAYSLCGSTVL